MADRDKISLFSETDFRVVFFLGCCTVTQICTCLYIYINASTFTRTYPHAHSHHEIHRFSHLHSCSHTYTCTHTAFKYTNIDTYILAHGLAHSISFIGKIFFFFLTPGISEYLSSEMLQIQSQRFHSFCFLPPASPSLCSLPFPPLPLHFWSRLLLLLFPDTKS